MRRRNEDNSKGKGILRRILEAADARGTMASLAFEIDDETQLRDAPLAAEALGLGDRYRYFHGRSGRRYLFSAVSVDALEDYRNAVLVLEPRTAPQGDAATAWIGEIDRYGARRGKPLSPSRLKRMRAYVHLLASVARDRRDVLDDLIAPE